MDPLLSVGGLTLPIESSFVLPADAAESIAAEAGTGTGMGAGAIPAAATAATGTESVTHRDLSASVDPISEYNLQELQLLDRLYAIAEKAMVGSDKDLNLLMSVVVDNSSKHILAHEFSIRTADTQIEQQLLVAKRRFLYTKLDQFNAYLKKFEAKRIGIMFSLQEMQQRMKFALKQTHDNTLEAFLAEALGQKKRWVPAYSSIRPVAEATWTTEPAEEPFAYNLVNVSTDGLNKMDAALKKAVEQFRKQLETSTQEMIPVIPDAFLVREYRPIADFKRRFTTTPLSHSRDMLIERHLELIPAMKVEKHPEYSEQIVQHIARIDQAIHLVDLAIAGLMEIITDAETTEIIDNESSEAKKKAALALQNAQDGLLIQRALRNLLLTQKELTFYITKDEDFMPVAPTKLRGIVLCDPITTTELRFRMLTPLAIIVENERKEFKKFCRANLDFLSEMSASGTIHWRATSDEEFLDRYATDFIASLESELAPLIQNWEEWNPEEIDLSDSNPRLLKSLQDKIELKRQELLTDIKNTDREFEKITKLMQRHRPLIELLANTKQRLQQFRLKRFQIMLGEHLTEYEAARERRERQFFRVDATGSEVLRDYVDLELLAIYFPGTRVEKLVQLLNSGLPVSYSGKQAAGSNLLHLALSNVSEKYDVKLVAIVQYLLKQNVNAAQLNVDGVSPCALIKMRLDSVISHAQPWVKEVVAIQFFCSEAAALALLKPEDPASLQRQLELFIDKARNLILAEEARIQNLSTSSSLILFRTPLIDFGCYEDALCASQQNLYGLFSILLGVAASLDSSSHPFTKKFVALVKEFRAQPVVKRVMTQIEEVKLQQQKQLPEQVALARASLMADFDALQRALATANARIEAAERGRVAAELRVEAADQRAEVATRAKDRVEAEIRTLKQSLWGSSSASSGLRFNAGARAGADSSADPERSARAGAGAAAEEIVDGYGVAASC